MPAAILKLLRGLLSGWRDSTDNPKMQLFLTISLILLAFASPPKGSGTSAAQGATAPVVLSAKPTASGEREKLLQVARGQLGTQEATGHNDGPVVKYLTAAGASKGDPYCAAFVYWCGREALVGKNPFPKSAWSPDFVARAQWVKGQGPIPRGGDTFGIYFADKGRVAHTGLVERLQGASAVTIEANTSAPAKAGSAADREGDGVWRKIRPLTSIYKIQSWFP